LVRVSIRLKRIYISKELFLIKPGTLGNSIFLSFLFYLGLSDNPLILYITFVLRGSLLFCYFLISLFFICCRSVLFFYDLLNFAFFYHLYFYFLFV